MKYENELHQLANELAKYFGAKVTKRGNFFFIIKGGFFRKTYVARVNLVGAKEIPTVVFEKGIKIDNQARSIMNNYRGKLGGDIRWTNASL